VLVVDDNEINRLVAVELLTELGYQTDTARNGHEAVSKASAIAFDAILMDCQMPELDGFQATEQIRRLEGPRAKVPIIALTAHAMPDDRDRVLRGGMDDYATKPIRAQQLDRLLRRWIPNNTPPRMSEPDAVTLELPVIKNRDLVVRRSPLMAADNLPDLDPTIARSPRAIELFLQTVPELIRELGGAVSMRDVPAVKRVAHKLKGTCLSLGANNMAAACHAVELAALQGTIDVDNSERIPNHLAIVAPLLNQLAQSRASNDNNP
jgi:CheY-like chemotaxis protein